MVPLRSAEFEGLPVGGSPQRRKWMSGNRASEAFRSGDKSGWGYIQLALWDSGSKENKYRAQVVCIQWLSVLRHSHVSWTALRVCSRLGVQKLARMTNPNSSWGQDSSAWPLRRPACFHIFSWIQGQILRPSAKRIRPFRPFPAHQH